MRTINIQYDYSKLRGLIREKIGTEGEFAKRIGRTQNFVSSVFRGLTYFYHEDIQKAADVLGISKDDIGLYFFTKKVHETELDEVSE